MSDESQAGGAGGPKIGAPANGAGATGAARAAPLKLPQIQIASQYVKDLSFENPSAPKSLRSGNPAPQVRVNVDVRTNKLSDSDHEVVLNLKAEATINNDPAFVVELAYGGVIHLDADTASQLVPPILLIEAPRLLFPFARAVIAEASRNGGYPPLMIQPIDFAEMFRKQLAQMRNQAGPGQPPTPPST